VTPSIHPQVSKIPVDVVVSPAIQLIFFSGYLLLIQLNTFRTVYSFVWITKQA
jgi:hypothetical protein